MASSSNTTGYVIPPQSAGDFAGENDPLRCRNNGCSFRWVCGQDRALRCPPHCTRNAVRAKTIPFTQSELEAERERNARLDRLGDDLAGSRSLKFGT